MPVGIPKVPFRIPEEEDASWVDVFLGQEVDAEVSNQIVGLMVFLSLENDTRDLYLFLNSPGGWVIPGMAIYDTMQIVKPDIHTICMGLAASMGSLLLVGGEITKRTAFPHAWRVMIHQPTASFRDEKTGEFILETEELLKLRESLTRIYVRRTDKPFWVVSEDMERDVFMSATEAQAHGIVDGLTLL
nr:clp protease proteolytic subunit [Canarium album]